MHAEPIVDREAEAQLRVGRNSVTISMLQDLDASVTPRTRPTR